LSRFRKKYEICSSKNERGVGKRSKKLTDLRSKTGVCKHHHYRHNFKTEKTMDIKKKFRRVGSFSCRGEDTFYTNTVKR